jgi:transposase
VGNESTSWPCLRIGSRIRQEFGLLDGRSVTDGGVVKDCRIDTVAMQATGVYSIPLYDYSDRAWHPSGLVNARHTKNVPGRKSDVQECQWLMKLHTYGLLRDSFRLRGEMERADDLELRDRHVQRRQPSRAAHAKALTKMNISCQRSQRYQWGERQASLLRF